MSAYGIAASYWILAISLGVLALLFIFMAMDGLARGKGDPSSVVMAAFSGTFGLILLYFSVNGLWEFSLGQTRTLDYVVAVWQQAGILSGKFIRMLRLM